MNKDKPYQANELMDYFERKSGSKQWPSDNPKDSPFDRFSCKLCPWTFKERMYGSFQMGHENDAENNVKKRILEHLAVRHHIEIPLRLA